MGRVPVKYSTQVRRCQQFRWALTKQWQRHYLQYLWTKQRQWYRSHTKNLNYSDFAVSTTPLSHHSLMVLNREFLGKFAVTCKHVYTFFIFVPLEKTVSSQSFLYWVICRALNPWEGSEISWGRIPWGLKPRLQWFWDAGFSEVLESDSLRS